MTKRQIPNFTVTNIRKLLETSVTLEEFWIKISEARVISIDENLLKQLIEFKNDTQDHTKFLKILRAYDNPQIIKNNLPKYIVQLLMSNKKFDSYETKEAKILEVFDNMIGKEQVKITALNNSTLQIEVWLKDEDDYAAFEFYAFSNKDLFFS